MRQHAETGGYAYVWGISQARPLYQGRAWRYRWSAAYILAVSVGFEPTDPCRSTVFKTAPTTAYVQVTDHDGQSD